MLGVWRHAIQLNQIYSYAKFSKVKIKSIEADKPFPSFS